MRTPILFLAAALAACTATAESPPEPAAAPPAAPSPPCASDMHDDFDFWIGEWDVFAPNGTKAGENSITRAEYGCLLIERWVDTGGVTGQSYNFVDPITNKWRQVWVSGGAVIDYSGRLTETGAMRLEGSIAYQSGGPVRPFRGEWTPNADGTVTQVFEQRDPDSGAWQPWFTGTYIRKAGAAPD